MKRIVLWLLAACYCWGVQAQQVPNPASFLGYKPGEQYTPHYKIVQYFTALAQAKNTQVQLQQYGTTNEGRPLLLCFVGSAANMAKLASIQQQNLALAGLGKSTAANSNNPAIVWLSYNVHGNEPSSSEAAMQTVYELLTNTSYTQWLNNTIVIIDPCLNPDGRDRYVQWYNSMRGSMANADPQSREHMEPWPGGRTNHYNFDLNRDWAWQTQIETQQRIKVYNQWLPQVHVDFHEQGYNAPYYFAPAAEPYHEVVTNWQRSFQHQIGRNHASYFDANGWLYFTKELFDLFYPSYGDTYPMYNGSIGMTYEQAGHSRGGLAVATDNGDTLTLTDRVKHHTTTGLSTIEMASKHADKLVQEFKKFFEDGSAGKYGQYKTYVLTSNEAYKIQQLKKLLTDNGIQYGNLTTTSGKGFNYQTLKEEDVQLQTYHVAISSHQPKGALVQVLLEPKNKLSDSATYDITAWSLPYAYGVQAYATKDRKDLKETSATMPSATAPAATSYGYLLPYTGVNSAKAMAYLLQKGIKVRYSEKPFTYKSTNYERGTLIIIKNGNNLTTLQQQMAYVVEKFGVDVANIETGFMDKGLGFGSSAIRTITAPKVALLTGDGANANAAGELWHFFDQQLQYPLSLLNGSDLSRINLKAYTTLLIPDGYFKALNDKNTQEKLKEFVRGGGRVIALEGAVSQLANADLGIKLKEDKSDDKEKTDEYAALKKYADRERDELPNNVPGAIFKVELDNTHPLAFGYSNTYYTLKSDTRMYEFLKEGWNVGYLKKDNYVTGFAGYKSKQKIKDGTVIGMVEFGNGQLVFFAEDPIFRSFWENGKLLLCNAIFL